MLDAKRINPGGSRAIHAYGAWEVDTGRRELRAGTLASGTSFAAASPVLASVSRV